MLNRCIHGSVLNIGDVFLALRTPPPGGCDKVYFHATQLFGGR